MRVRTPFTAVPQGWWFPVGAALCALCTARMLCAAAPCAHLGQHQLMSVQRGCAIVWWSARASCCFVFVADKLSRWRRRCCGCGNAQRSLPWSHVVVLKVVEVLMGWQEQQRPRVGSPQQSR